MKCDITIAHASMCSSCIRQNVHTCIHVSMAVGDRVLKSSMETEFRWLRHIANPYDFPGHLPITHAN